MLWDMNTTLTTAALLTLTLGTVSMAQEVGMDLHQPARLSSMSKSSSMAQSVAAQSMGFTGKGVTVALIDSGVDSTHPDLVGVVVEEVCFCMDENGAPCCPNGTTRQAGVGSAKDDNGHGTHLAGIIAGRGRIATKGMAPEAHIVSIKVADAYGSTSTWAMIAALDWLVTNRKDVKVVNMSLGTNATYAGACDQASAVTASLASLGNVLRDRGTVIVTAAGNSGLMNQMTAPACVTGFISVGAVYSKSDRTASANGCTDAKTSADRVACFSNSSSTLSILAPGAGIVSAKMGGGKANRSGTSQAAAVITGTVALLLEAAPSGSSQMESALRGSGVSVTDSRNGRVTPRLDARAALTVLGGL